MDLKRVRAFVAVAEHGTVSKAAHVLHVTQPALSRQIGALEQDVGFELFERAGRRLSLTPRADQLLADCRSLLSHASALDDRAQALRRGDMKELKLAASAITIEGMFPRFMQRFSERFPGVRLTLVEADAADHLDMLTSGEAHLAINVVNAVDVDDHRFGTYLLPRFCIMAVGSPSLEFGEAGNIEIRALSGYPLLLPDMGYATRQLFDAACRVAGVRPTISLESVSAHTLLALAEAGHGIAVIPSVFRPDRSKLRVRCVTHRGQYLQIALAVLWDKQRTLPHYAQTFSETLAEHLNIEFPPPAPPRAQPARSPRLAAPKSSRRLSRRPAVKALR